MFTNMPKESLEKTLDGMMKQFDTPEMTIQRLEAEEIVRTSGCWESYDCEKCYDDAVVCGGTYTCTGLVCGCLGALHT